MEGIKRITKRITGLIIFVIEVLILVIAARILNIVGVWRWIDSFYPSGLFWVLLIVSRIIFGAGWISASISIGKAGGKAGFFMFYLRDDFTPMYKKKDIDLSPLITLTALAAIPSSFLVDTCIRLVVSTGNLPFFYF